jgi:hypothetical protein
MATKQHKNTNDLFEASKNEFIQNVRATYEKFLSDNGVDLENEIRQKVLKELKLAKKEKKLQKKQKEDFRVARIGIVSDILCDVENSVADKIQEFYGDLVDLDIISEWYYQDCNVTIVFYWNDNTLKITNYDGVLKMSGDTKELRKYIKSHKELIRDFIDASDEYYYLHDDYDC